MTLSWSSTCIKYLLFVFNLLFVVSGIILLSVGVSIKAYYREYEIFLDQSYISTPNLLISIGAIIFFIAFFGCCGAVKENFCMIITFSTLLILIFVLEFAAGISGYVLRNKTHDFLEEHLRNSMKYYNITSDPIVTEMWDKMQMTFSCCGANSYTDWDYINSTDHKLPMTCCGLQVGQVGLTGCNKTTETLHTAGCVNKFGEWVEDHALTIGGLGLGIALMQLMGIIFSCHLSKQIKLNYETV